MTTILRALGVAALALSACASGAGYGGRGTIPPDRSVTNVAGAEIVVVHDAIEARTAAEVARAIPGAVRRAGRWGPLRSATIVVHGSERRFRAAVGDTGRESLRAWTRDDVIQLREPGAWGPLGAAPGELEEVLAHELVHCAMNQRLGPPGTPRPSVPFWFREGIAIEPQGAEHEGAIRARLHALERWRVQTAPGGVLAQAGTLLSGHPDLAYAIAYVAVRTLITRHGEAIVGRILDGMRAGDDFDRAFAAATGTQVAAFDREVRRVIER